jgi:hypothetical protein
VQKELEVQLKIKVTEVSALIETLEVEKAKTNAIKEVIDIFKRGCIKNALF